MSRKLLMGTLCLGLFYIIIQTPLFLSCNAITSTSESLEILVVKESNLSAYNLQMFKTHFFIEQKAITETEYSGERYSIFDLININKEDFTDYFKGYQNIIFLSSGDKFSIREKKENWRNNQTVIYFTIDSTATETNIKVETKKTIQRIKEKEISRRKAQYMSETPKNIKEFVQRKFHSTIALPSGFSIVDTADNFLDLRRDFKTGTQRIIITKVPRKICDSKEEIINKKNEIAQEHITGEDENIFAIVESIYANVYMETLNKNKLIELRGLWKMKNEPAPMGGPFITYIFKEFTPTESLLIDFYIFDPGQDKADHLMDAEAIGTSVVQLN